MLSILVNAYACSPNMGSEPGMAWNWCINLARYCELHIITEGEFREKIEVVVPTLPQGKNMHFYYNPVSEEVRRMCWNQGDWRFYKYYRKWQYSTYEMAQHIIKEHRIDMLHQLNMIGFREPGYLWKIKEVPLVWGPVDAKEKFPIPYLQGSGLKQYFFMRLKNFITGLQLQYGKRVRNMVHGASVVVSASSESKKSFKKYFNVDSPLLNETGCYPQCHYLQNKSKKQVLDLLWVGKLDFRKQLGLAIRTVAEMKNERVYLHVVGGGDATPYKQQAEQWGVTKQCIWHGAMMHAEVQQLMQQADVFFFTSVAEGTPHVVLEAIGNNLPVVCFDVCGHGDSVNEQVGRKINLSNPEQSVQEFANILNTLEADRKILKLLSANCKQRQEELSWDNKAKQMVKFYETCIDPVLKRSNLMGNRQANA